jgi:hypothetical protein
VDADGVTERWKEAAGEQLDPLGFLEGPGAEQQALDSVGVLLHGARAAALGQLKERG